MEEAMADSPYSDSPALIFWEITQACDLKCKHCRAEAVPHRDDGELTTAEIKKQLRIFGEEMSGVIVFTGGDPFRRPDLVELVSTCDENGLKPALTPSTTPLLTENRLADLQDAGLKMIALSLDGPDAFRQDQFRREENTFLHTLRGIRAAHKLDLPLQINTTICAETLPWLEEIGDVVAKANVFRWALFFLVRTGEGRQLNSISPDETRQVFRYLHEWSETNSSRVKTTNAPHFRKWKIENADANPRPGIIDGDGIMFVSHTGDVYPSGFLPRNCGNVRNRNALSIYRNHILFKRIRKRKLRGRCGSCEYQRTCGGSRANALAENDHPLDSDPRCDYQPDGAKTKTPSRKN